MQIKYPLLALLLLVSFCSETSTISDCNPEEGRFISGRHYVSGNLLTEENNWNLIEFQKYINRRSNLYPDSRCIPVTQPSTFEETIADILEDIDYQGRGME